jgi:hypothetical protein
MPSLGDVAVRSAPDVQLRSVRGGDQALGPVVIDGAARQIDHLRRRHLIDVLPSAYGTRTSASLFAMYN